MKDKTPKKNQSEVTKKLLQAGGVNDPHKEAKRRPGIKKVGEK